MPITLDPFDMVARLALAVLMGGVIGFEREWSHKPAGLRTHMMVCLGAATFTLVAEFLIPPPGDPYRVDPTRLVQGVIGGIGFLGAGTIIQSRGSVHGLTTAGSLWFTGALGVAVGAGAYILAGSALVLALVVLTLVGLLGRWLNQNSSWEEPHRGGK
jgi:putative Mg2+ transporter-C (MgtC) family protein